MNLDMYVQAQQIGTRGVSLKSCKEAQGWRVAPISRWDSPPSSSVQGFDGSIYVKTW